MGDRTIVHNSVWECTVLKFDQSWDYGIINLTLSPVHWGRDWSDENSRNLELMTLSSSFHSLAVWLQTCYLTSLIVHVFPCKMRPLWSLTSQGCMRAKEDGRIGPYIVLSSGCMFHRENSFASLRRKIMLRKFRSAIRGRTQGREQADILDIYPIFTLQELMTMLTSSVDVLLNF